MDTPNPTQIFYDQHSEPLTVRAFETEASWLARELFRDHNYRAELLGGFNDDAHFFVEGLDLPVARLSYDGGGLYVAVRSDLTDLGRVLGEYGFSAVTQTAGPRLIGTPSHESEVRLPGDVTGDFDNRYVGDRPHAK